MASDDKRQESTPGAYPNRDPQLFYELARDRHAGQAALLDSLDSKLVFLLSSSSALVGILLAVYALRPDGFHGWEFVLPFASGAAWLALSAFVLHAFWVRGWLSGPKLQKVFNRQFGDENDATQKWHVANHFWCDYNKNKPLEDRKTRAIRVSMCLLVAQTALLAATLVLVALAESETTYRSQTPSKAVRDARVALPVALAHLPAPAVNGRPAPDRPVSRHSAVLRQPSTRRA